MKYLNPNHLLRGDEQYALVEIAYQLERIANALNGQNEHLERYEDDSELFGIKSNSEGKSEKVL